YRKTVLSNGLRIVTEAIPHVRSVSIGVWIDVGSRDEDMRTNGISHFIEHMVFKGTENRSTREISRSIESVGGYLNAFTSKEHTCFYARVLDEHTKLAIDVLSDLSQHAVFPEREVEKEKGVVIEELRNAEDDPDDIIHDYFEKSLYGSHPMGFPVIGTEENLRSFTRKDLLRYRSSYYVPSRMVLAAAGNVKHDEIVELAARFFGKNGGTLDARARRQRPGHGRKEELVIERPIQQAHVCLGTVAFSIKSRNRYPLLVLNTLLGDGMSSRLFQNIREKYGFAYSVYSFVSMVSDTGAFGTYIGTDRSHVNPSIDLIFKELSKLKEKLVSEAELKRTKAQLKGSMMLSLESIANRMMRLGSSELYFQELSPLDTIIKQIDAVSRDDLQRLAHILFRDDRFSRVIFQPTNDQGRKSSDAAPRAAAAG
ncbi:MAG: insulinase family protein, partial [Ignavibacteriales bacterium]|nr:insulinase family protein [Ignavibacteriales bacterium]